MIQFCKNLSILGFLTFILWGFGCFIAWGVVVPPSVVLRVTFTCLVIGAFFMTCNQLARNEGNPK